MQLTCEIYRYIYIEGLRIAQSVARCELKNRQYTIYAKGDGDLARWKTHCPTTMTLNGWLVELIENSIEEIENPSGSPKGHSEEINRLRKENIELELQNKQLAKRIGEFEDAIRTRPSHPDQRVVKFLQNGGILQSATIPGGSWVIVDAFSHKEKQTDGEPSEADVREFQRELMYTTIKVISRDITTKTLIIRPRDSAGAVDDNKIVEDIGIQRAKTVSYTIEQLENLGLVESTRRGYKWIS